MNRPEIMLTTVTAASSANDGGVGDDDGGVGDDADEASVDIGDEKQTAITD